MRNLYQKHIFFLNGNETEEIKQSSSEVFNIDMTLIDQSNIYYMNRKNDILDKIIECIEENKEINIKGFFNI